MTMSMSRLGRLGVAAVLLAMAAAGGSAAADEGQVTVKTLFSGTRNAADQPIELPAGPLKLIVSQYDIPPGTSLPVHKHPYQRYGIVQAGTLRVTNADTGAATVYHAGDVIVEMVDLWHTGTNIGTDPVRILVIDQVPPDKSNTVLRDAR
jgi:quercetin dioxygenase-like cupin family protein